jgi:hypothetical protein
MSAKGAEHMPAPNAYSNASKDSVLKSAPSFGFGSSKRPQTADARKQPGPGAYESKSIIGTESQGKTLGSKLGNPKSSNMLTPGPGTYNAKHEASLQASPGWKMGTSTRDDKAKARLQSSVPPPNTYNPNFSATKSKDPSFGFGSGKRQPMSAKFQVPAPGTYTVPGAVSKEGPSYHMGAKCDN